MERYLVGGECDYYACIPSKTLLRPGEALEAAREAPGAREAVTGKLDPPAAFEWRNFMVADYQDSSKVGWLEDQGIDLLRGPRGSPVPAGWRSARRSTAPRTS